ncbi:MAG: class I SAM-dependent RNA methyltransferase [Spirochaetaceae bacterium]|jgi:putative N6-adenine-specific DNA methylase|nr:class I SAM-dependent RNA methyltransferase [Spirochaetaceae bacterium]
MCEMMNAWALCGVGAEKVLSLELKKLGFTVRGAAFGKVRFKADTQGLYRALMSLRTADRVLLEAAAFPAPDFDALFEGVRAVPWEDFLKTGMGLRIAKVRVNRSRLHAPASIQGIVHKAAADRLCRNWGLSRLPEQGKQGEVRVYLEKDQAAILLDLSGAPLFKRGYRTEGGLAPLRETTAAAILLMAGWRRKFPLYDPFCGSGTIAIEAALYAWDMAPGLGRDFALSDLAMGNRELERSVRQELLAQVNVSRIIRLHGSDEDPRAVSLAQSNVVRAYELAQGKSPGKGIRKALAAPWLPDFTVCPLRQLKAPYPAQEGFIITNPPYGKRLGDQESAEALYQHMDILSRKFPAWKLAVITNHPGFESFFGKKAEQGRAFTQGALPSYFFLFTL